MAASAVAAKHQGGGGGGGHHSRRGNRASIWASARPDNGRNSGVDDETPLRFQLPVTSALLNQLVDLGSQALGTDVGGFCRDALAAHVRERWLKSDEEVCDEEESEESEDDE